MKLFRMLTAAVPAVVIALVATLFSPTAATAAPASPVAATSTLAAPQVQCQTLTSVDSNWKDWETVMAIGSIADFLVSPDYDRLSFYQDLFEVYQYFRDSTVRSSAMYPFIAQLSWEEVPGAIGYAIQPPHGQEKRTQDTVIPFSDFEHTISPDPGEEFPSDIVRGGGQVHLGYFVYALYPNGQRSLATMVPITVTRATPGAPAPASLPAVSCGHNGSPMIPIQVPAPWSPPVSLLACAMRTVNGEAVMRLSWDAYPGADSYEVDLVNEAGRTVDNLERTSATTLDLDRGEYIVLNFGDDLDADHLSVAVSAITSDGAGQMVAKVALVRPDEAAHAGCGGWDGNPVVSDPVLTCRVQNGMVVARWTAVPNATKYSVHLYSVRDKKWTTKVTFTASARQYSLVRNHLVDVGGVGYLAVVAHAADGSTSSMALRYPTSIQKKNPADIGYPACGW